MILAISTSLRVYNDFTYIGNILISRLRATVKHGYYNILDSARKKIMLLYYYTFSKLKRELSSGGDVV